MNFRQVAVVDPEMLLTQFERPLCFLLEREVPVHQFVERLDGFSGGHDYVFCLTAHQTAV
jgi:hypothetical protein